MKKQLSTSKSSVFWNYVQEEENKVTVLLYGDIGNSQKVDPAEVVSQLMDLSNRFSKIDIHINSNGGDVFSGISIYNALCKSKADITIYIDGVAASIAGIIALCGKPLYMSRYARLMIHSISGGMYGNKAELQDMISIIENMEGVIAEMISERCKKSKEELKALYFDGKDHWITAQEALSIGIIDGIYDVNDSISDNDKSNNEAIYNFFYNKLTERKNQQSMELFNKIKNLSSFADMQTEEQVLSRIKELEANQPYQNIQNARLLMNRAVEEGVFARKEADALLNLSGEDVNRLRVHIDKKKQDNKAIFENEYANLTKHKSEYSILRDLPDTFIRGELKQFALKDFRTFKTLVEVTRKKMVTDYISLSPDEQDKTGWTLDDYRKKSPKELRNNPKLYKDLLERELQK